jgi:NAD(P)H-hydrate epimerase
MHLATTEQMRQMEAALVERGTSTWPGLMEQAGWGVAQEALRVLGEARKRHVLVLVGPGNNGGDGLVAARHLHDAGATVTLYIWKRKDDASDTNWQACRERDMPQVAAADDKNQSQLRKWLKKANLVIDALLGMGQSRLVEGTAAKMVALVNEHAQAGTSVLAIDVPTGIQSDSGAVLGVAVRASLTVATGLPKRGLMLYPGRAHAGTVALADIGIPADDLETIMSTTISKEQARALLPARPDDSHKGTFGKVMVVAGSLNYPGAAGLATGGAGRVGAGLVTLATVRSVIALSGRGPDVTLLPLHESPPGAIDAPAADEIFKAIEGYGALLIGPGMGREKNTQSFIQRLFGLEQSRKSARVGFRVSDETDSDDTDDDEAQVPPPLPALVLDADALNILSEMDDWTGHLPAEQCILTPHPGEIKRLLAVDTLDTDLVQLATDAAQQWKQVVVLKGATTVVAAPDGRNAVHAAGNAALATAGTGDVLAGAIAGLVAQGLDLFDAAVLGTYLHSEAGVLLREEMGDMGTLATDLLPRLPRAIKALKG